MMTSTTFCNPKFCGDDQSRESVGPHSKDQMIHWAREVTHSLIYSFIHVCVDSS